MSQVIFTMDKALKDRALRKAKAQGIPFAAVLKMAVKAFADGSLGVRLVEEDPPLRAASAKLLKKALADTDAKKNLSQEFSNAEDALRYVKQKA